MTDQGPASYARSCVEAFVKKRPAPAPPQEPLYAQPAACFVSLKKHSQLRGCIGTLTPAELSLGRELARNAHSAAFSDPRFPPVTADELADLICSVDVLGEPESCELCDLDPSRYGVIVSCGWRRGVLLPDLPGVDSVARQVGIALQKASIDPDERFAVQRFGVRRYAEGDAEGHACGALTCPDPGCQVRDQGADSEHPTS
jgi:AmmeMemoRadiSam system protein A